MVDERAMRLADSAKGLFARLRVRLDGAQQQIMRIEPHRLVGHKRIELQTLAARSLAGVKSVFAKKELQLTAGANRLEALNPRSVLNRGYSITTNLKSGKVVTSGADVEVGDLISTEVAKQGVIESEVKKVGRRGK